MDFRLHVLSFIYQYGFQGVVKDDPVCVFSSIGRSACARKTWHEIHISWISILIFVHSLCTSFFLPRRWVYLWSSSSVCISCRQWGVVYPQYTSNLCSVTPWYFFVCNNLRFSDFHFIVPHVQQVLETDFIAYFMNWWRQIRDNQWLN